MSARSALIWRRGLVPWSRRLGGGGAAALVVMASIGLLVCAGPWLWPADPNAVDMGNRFAGWSREHPLGTDQYGRDILSRLMHGGRVSVAGATLVLAGNTTAGVVVGAAAGYARGAAEMVVSRFIDAWLAFPSLVIALAIVGALGRSFEHLLFALVLSSWPWYARIYRGLVRSESHRDYTLAARSLGATPLRVVGRHVLSNITGPAIVLTTISFGSAILSLTALSFLGLGLQAPNAEWGAMINGARGHFQSHPWLMVAPGVAISLSVLAANILGDAVRDVSDPRRRSRMSSQFSSRVPAVGVTDVTQRVR